MSVIEEISNMKNQGVSEEDIITALREGGVSPKEIKDAISQLKIKNAISTYESNEEENFPPEKKQETGNSLEQNYDYPAQAYPPQEYAPQGYPQEGYAPQEGYEYSQTAGFDTNTIIEISEQIFSEKIKSIKKDLDSFNEFRNINQIRMENLNERFKRIENVFDKLQITILEKIGSYGQNLETIKKEMNMMQNSFSKIVEPLVDNAEKKYEKKKRPSRSKVK